jgi:hypothetical protein
LLGDGAPDPQRGVALTSSERKNPHLTGVLGVVQVSHYLVADLGVAGEETQRNHVVGLATAHSLRENENALLGSAFEPAESLFQKALHTVCAPVLFKELFRVNLAFDQVGKVKNNVTTGTVENALSGSAKLLQALHGRALLTL